MFTCETCPFFEAEHRSTGQCLWERTRFNTEPTTPGCRHHPKAPHPVFRETKDGSDVVVKFEGYSQLINP